MARRRVYLSILFLTVLVFSCGKIWKNRFGDKRALQKRYKSKEQVWEFRKDHLLVWDIQAGEVVADVGGYDGIEAATISVYTDSATIYVEDPDTSNFDNWPLIKDHFEDIRGSSFTNDIIFVGGTYDTTNLPFDFFDKVLLNNVLQYVPAEGRPDFLKEINLLLKKDGHFFIRTPVAKNDVQKDYLFTERELIKLIQAQKFKFVDQHDVLGGINTIYVFQK
jgi:SAM-dependent methyltransferase